MFAVWRLLLLLHIRLTLAQTSPPIFGVSRLKCSSLCGLPFEAKSDYDGNSYEKITVNFSGQCVGDSQLSIGNWEKSARRFLQLISMNDTSFDCPKWNSVYRKPNKTELPSFWRKQKSYVTLNGTTIFRSPYFRTSVVNPAAISGVCDVTVDRGVIAPKVNGPGLRLYWMEADLQYGGKPLITIGSIISLWSQPEIDVGIHPRPVRLEQDRINGCHGNNCSEYQMVWLPASTFGTWVAYQGNTTKHYSIFAKWNFQQIPGIDGMMVKLRGSVSHLENVLDELSYSNIAILSLPLLMAIPPISLFDNFSNMATAWYVFATDILATLPLLIKGIELVIVYPRTKVNMYSTLSMIGKRYGVYERWFTQCYPPIGRTHTIGTIIILIAFWFMIASSYCEFAFWRALQYRNGRLNSIPEISSDSNHEESEEVDESKSSDSESNSWYKRHRGHILKGAFLSLIALFICPIVIRSWGVYISASIALVAFRIIGMNSFSQLLRWKFLAGIILGFVGIPLYWTMNVNKSIHESKSWDDFADGASIGMAVLGAIVVGTRFTFLFHCIFTWFYGAAILVFHAIRSSPSDRVRWRYGLNGFAAGMLFGPFGIFFKRCFPETTKDKQVRANFHEGFCSGVIFLLTVFNFIVWLWVNKRNPPR